MSKYLDENGLTYLWSKIKATFVSGVSISGNNLRITKNGSNTDLTVPFATNSGTATKIGSSTVGSTTMPVYVNSGTPTVINSIPGKLVQGTGINSFMNTSTGTGINPAINGAGMNIAKGGSVRFLFDGFEFEFTDHILEYLFDGLNSTYFSPLQLYDGLLVSPSNYLYSSTKTYKSGDIVRLNNSSNAARWYRSLSNNNVGHSPSQETDNTYWEYMSSPTASYATGLNAQKLSKIEVLVTLATPAVYESGVSIYWRTAGQHPRYVTLEKYNSTFTESLGKCCDNYDMQNEVVTSIYCGTVSTANGTNFKFTFTGFPNNNYWSLSFTQIAFTGLIGGIEGTVVMRKGGSYSSMFGDFYPYKDLGANLGTSSFRWYNVYSGYGNFSNTLTANGGITVPNGKTITINGKAVLTEHQDISGKANASDVVTALGTNGNNITWTRNGTVNNLTVPYATKALQDGNGNSITDTYLKLGEPMQPTLFYSGDASKFYLEHIMDGMWAADKRWKVNAILTDTSTGTETSLSSYDISGWFNGDYGRVGYRFGDNKTLKITIQAGEDPETNYFTTYDEGYLILNFYWYGLPSSVSGRFYYGSAGKTTWTNITFTRQKGQRQGIYISNHLPNAFGRIIELTIVGQTLTDDPKSTALASIEWWKTRAGINDYPVVHKYSPQTLLYALTAPQFIKSGGTSSQFLKADGSVDSTSYAPQSNTYSKTEVDNALNTKQASLVSGTNIKTINGNSILGEGNISISGASGGEANVIESVKVNGTALTVTNKAVDITAVPASIVTQDATHRFVSDTEKSTWNSKVSTDTKNTAGATATTVTGSNKFYLVGAPKQTANPTTNTINYFYVDASGLNIPTDINALQKTATLGKIILPGTGGGILADGTGGVLSTTKVWNTSGSYTDISGFITSSDLPTLSKGTTTGSGNAVTDISVSGHLITLTKGSTFLQPGASSDDIEYSEDQHYQTTYFLDGVNLTLALLALDEAVSTKPTDSLVVHKEGSETITGVKTFSPNNVQGSIVISNGTYDAFIEHSASQDFSWIKRSDSFDLQSELNLKENSSNKVTSISSSSTNTQYPSALAVYNFGTNLVSQLATIYSGSGAPASSLGNNGDIYIKVT